ncbi:MAG: O-antigen ligase family protein [Microbacterium sp.]|nr:O-antigen ligase family protein [Microbacterium sp.]
MTIEVVVALGVCTIVAVAIATTRIGLVSTIAYATFFSLALVPVSLVSDSGAFHVGIAGSSPDLRTFTLIIAAGAVLLTFIAKPPLVGVFVPLMLWIGIGGFFIWPADPPGVAGVIQYCIAILAWGIGMRAARSDPDSHLRRGLVLLIVVVVMAHSGVAVLQALGLNINAVAAADQEILGSRVNGLSNHPNNLGKILVISIALLLSLINSAKERTRLIWITIAVAFVPLVLAQGRANLAAAAALVTGWVLLQPTLNLSRKLSVLLGIGVAGLAASGVIISRFEEDPTGGVRSEILSYAWHIVSTFFWNGTGPNRYTTENAPLTGSFIPVHNSFVLALAELGVIGFVLLFAPIVMMVIGAWRHRHQLSTSGDTARAIVASALPMVMIAYTGWGMLATSVFSLGMFCFGFMWGHTSARHCVDQSPTQALLNDSRVISLRRPRSRMRT